MEKVTTSSNPFVVLCPSDDQNSLTLKEGEVQQSYVHIDEGEVNIEPQNQCGPLLFEIPCVDASFQEIHKSPSGTISSPSYAEILKKKPVDTYGSSKEYSREQFTKNASRKSRKEIREEEVERLKMQDIQAKIGMSIGRSKWNRPPKGGTNPFFLGKYCRSSLGNVGD